MQNMATTMQTGLTPSEVIMVRGDVFAPRAEGFLTTKTRLINSDLPVLTETLSRTILAAALLANEGVGNLRFEEQERTGFFGRRYTALMALAAHMNYRWPPDTLEDALCRIVADSKPLKVRELVYKVLESSASEPGKIAPNVIQRGLAKRGLVAKAPMTLRDFVLTDSRYTAPQSTFGLATSQAIRSVQDMLSATEIARPALWAMLIAQIDDAVDRRTDRSG